MNVHTFLLITLTMQCCMSDHYVRLNGEYTHTCYW